MFLETNYVLIGGDEKMDFIEVKSNGTVVAKKGTNPRVPYNHQKDAMAKLNLIDKEDSFSTLVVLPTGGGKTYTASTWLLKNAVDKKKKIIWIAHRQMLLDQAAESFQKFAYAEAMPHISEFTYRIVSGSSSHDRSIDISEKDNILILSKDSIGRNMSVLDKWIKGEKEIYLVIDEAHHATAKTYRKIIKYIEERVPNLKLLGLTATPFRTTKEEEGLLAKIFKDELLSRGYNVLMIRNDTDVQLDNIARTVIANNNANAHIALHWDSTTSDKGAFYMGVPDVGSYRSMEPVASNWKKHEALGKALVNGLSANGTKIFSDGRMDMDLTQTSYSTIPSIDIELGDKKSDYDKDTLRKLSKGLADGIDSYFGR